MYHYGITGVQWALLIALFVKHFLADFCWQTQYMVKGKSALDGWFAPLSLHAFVHASFTYLILILAACFGGTDYTMIPFLAVIDFCAHWIIDFCKAQFGNYPIHTKAFWNALGGDQLAHHLTYILIFFLVVECCWK